MSADPKADAPQKTPEQIRIENIQALRQANEEVITLALQRRGQLDNLLNGFVMDGQGNKYDIDQAKAEEKVAETNGKLKAARARVDDLQTKIAFKQPERVAAAPPA